MATSTKGTPKLVLVKITSDGIEHTRQVDAEQLAAYDEQGVDYTRVGSPMTGMEHLPEPTGSVAATDAAKDAELADLRRQLAEAKAVQPVNKSATPTTK